MWKKIFLISAVLWLYLGWAQSLKARVVSIHIYPHQVFIEESFKVSPGVNKLFLVGAPAAKDINCRLEHGALFIETLKVYQAPNQNPLRKALRKTRETIGQLCLQQQLLDQKSSLLKECLKASSTTPAPEAYQKYMTFLADYLREKSALEKKIASLKEKELELEKKAGPKRVSVLEVTITGQGEGILRVRYPAGEKILSYKQQYRVILDTTENMLTVQGQLILCQSSGVDWSDINIYLYPRIQATPTLAPPPFKPWFLDFFPVKIKTMAKARSLLPQKPLGPQREFGTGMLWERVKISSIKLVSGQETILNAEQKTFPAKLVFEIPVYATAKAYFRAEIIPPISLPPIKALFYRDHIYLGQAQLPAFVPGQKVRLYFGPAPLLEVKRELIKDTTGKPFLHRHREVTEKVWRTMLINHYSIPLFVEVIDRVPVSKHKDIKVKASAVPPWQELTPQGKVLWRFNMAPGALKEIKLRVEISRPRR